MWVIYALPLLPSHCIGPVKSPSPTPPQGSLTPVQLFSSNCSKALSQLVVLVGGQLVSYLVGQSVSWSVS